MKQRQAKKIIKKYGEKISEFTNNLSRYYVLREKIKRQNLINPKTCGVNIKEYNYNLTKIHNIFLMKYSYLCKWKARIPLKILRGLFPINIKVINT